MSSQGDLKGDALVDWEDPKNPLAPLSDNQRNIVLDLCQEIKETGPFYHSDEDQVEKRGEIETPSDFFLWFSGKEDQWLEEESECYAKYVGYLKKQRKECDSLLTQVEAAIENLKELGLEYKSVSDKTNSLHEDSEVLLDHQLKLVNVGTEIKEKLSHFKSLDRLIGTLDNTPHVSLTQVNNLQMLLDEIDLNISYHTSHSTSAKNWNYLQGYRQVLRRVLNLMKETVSGGLVVAGQQARCHGADYSGQYPRFQAAAKQLRPTLALLESRSHLSPEYELALAECEQVYVREREALLGPSVQSTLNEIFFKGAQSLVVGDRCAMMRAACAFLIHLSHDEFNLHRLFFGKDSEIFRSYLESLCTLFYDTSRPVVIHMKHLESLAELCSILRLEMLQEHVSSNREALAAFASVVEQLLQDVQERLVFRSHIYIKTDILEYKPSPGDLAYPEKLRMMQSIALNLQEQQEGGLARSESRGSLVSIGSAVSQDVAHITSSPHPHIASSPADLHGMWYPPVRRTLVTLSKLYRCVDRATFQGISQQALTACMTNVSQAAATISQQKTVFDGEMFQIKHLLILREQIAPFQVDFTVKEMSLDFSKTKTAAAQLLNKRTRLFSLSSNNALLEFLLEGSPEVKEQWLDSRKDVDKMLKSCCECFIANASNHLLGSLAVTVAKAKAEGGVKGIKAVDLRDVVQDANFKIKNLLTELQGTMQLYLANRDTEFILYRPIKNNVIGAFSELRQWISTSDLSEEERDLIGCPTPEQASVLLSSVSLYNL